MRQRWSKVLVATSGLAASCSQSHDSGPDLAARSGSRLRLRWLESDGLRVVVGLHDTQLGAHCSVQKAQDGELYCFPGAVQTKLFVDALCSQPAASAARCAPAPSTQVAVRPPWALGGTVGPCPFVELYSAHPPELLVSYFTQFAEASCIKEPVGPSEHFMAQRLSTRVSESTLVHLTEVQTTGKGVVQNRYLAGDDGALLPAGFVDARFGVCRPATAADGRTRCLPRTVASLPPEPLADLGCSVPIALASHPCGAPLPKLVGSVEPNPDRAGCGGQIQRLFELGEPIGEALLGSLCTGLHLGPGTFAHRLGKELAPDTFPLLDPVEVGAGRLRAKGWSAPGLDAMFGLESSLHSFSDTQLALSCSAATTLDNTLRCVPSASGLAYRDETCTRPYLFAREGCEAEEGPRFARLESDACQVSIHAVAHEAEALDTPYGKSGSNCVRWGIGATSGYALQEAVDPALFAQMSERVE